MPIPNIGPPEQTSAAKETYDMTVDPRIECENYDIGDLSSEDSMKNILRWSEFKYILQLSYHHALCNNIDGN